MGKKCCYCIKQLAGDDETLRIQSRFLVDHNTVVFNFNNNDEYDITLTVNSVRTGPV